MSTVPTVPGVQSNASLILTILTVALQALGTVPTIGAPVLVIEAFVKIIQAGVQAYQQETGQPIDLTKIPLETPVP